MFVVLGARDEQQPHGNPPPFPGPKPRAASRLPREFAVVVGAFAGFVLLAALLVALLVLHRRSSASDPTPAVPVNVAFDTTPMVVKSGDVLPALLGRAGLSPRTIGLVVPAMRAAGFNLRALRPGDSLFVLSRDSVPCRLLYRQSYEYVYRADFDSGACRVSMLLRSYRRVPDVIRGAIKSSLYQSIIDLGENVALVADYTDVFGWEVDFFSETQPGDSFVILFERKFAGDRPAGYGSILAARYSGRVGSFRGCLFTDGDNHTDYYNDEGQSLRKTFLKSPLRFSRISSRFGRRFHPIRRVIRPHFGVDYVAPTGTPVECVADGRVVSAGWSGGYGRLVKVGHANGYTTFYGHLSGFGKGIRPGAPVTQGQVIGYVGSTGLSTGPHLHYEAHKFGSATNPLKLNPPRASPVKLVYADQFGAVRDSLMRLMQVLSGPAPPRPVP
jgi:murein DD-endopeptidase MepM/ murein hydrolase activator NlpD